MCKKPHFIEFSTYISKGCNQILRFTQNDTTDYTS